MPVIQMTVADGLQTLKVDAGVYKGEMTECVVKPSNSGKGNNIFMIFTLRTGEGQKYNGKELKIASSTASSGDASILGSMYWVPKGYLNLIEAAVNDKPVDGSDHPIDTDTLLNRPMDLNVGASTADGNLINIITGFSPVGKGQGVPF